MVRLPVTLIESNKEVRESLAARHQHVLVDEYQDVNRASVRLLKSIVGQGERLWVVGDSRQSIYRFRGASSINMRRFSSDFPEATAKQLDVNYRSHKEIINLFTIFSNDMKASEGAIPLNLEAQKASCGAIPELLPQDLLCIPQQPEYRSLLGQLVLSTLSVTPQENIRLGRAM